MVMSPTFPSVTHVVVLIPLSWVSTPPQGLLVICLQTTMGGYSTPLSTFLAWVFEMASTLLLTSCPSQISPSALRKYFISFQAYRTLIGFPKLIQSQQSQSLTSSSQSCNILEGCSRVVNGEFAVGMSQSTLAPYKVSS